MLCIRRRDVRDVVQLPVRVREVFHFLKIGIEIRKASH